MPSHPADAAKLAPTRSRAVALAVAVFAFFLSAYVFTASADLYATGDTSIRIQVAENILGRWSVDLHGWKLRVPLHQKKEYIETRVALGRLNKTYSTYLLGQPLALLPFDWTASRFAVWERWPYGPTILFVDRLVGPLFGALEVLMVFLFAMRLGYGVKRALLLSLILGFATSVWPDEQSVLEHGQVAFFLLVAFYFAFRFREQGAGSRAAILSGVGIGGAAITRYQDAAVGLLALAVYLLLPGGPGKGIPERIRRGALVALGLLPFAALDAWYNWVRYGKLLATGRSDTLFGNPIWQGAAGLLVSPGKGLLWYSPTVLLLALAGWPFRRRFGGLFIAWAILAGGFITLYSYVTFWHGDPAWGPRYLYPLVPFLTLPLGELLVWRGRRKVMVRTLTALVVAASFVVQFSAVSVSEWRTWYRVIAYEENQGYDWTWVASRYRYFWNVQESPLLIQFHGLYQLAYDTVLGSNRYQIVPPDEDAALDGILNQYDINSWNFWWASEELTWWMGDAKVTLALMALVATMLAAGSWLIAESGGLFEEPTARRKTLSLPEAA